MTTRKRTGQQSTPPKADPGEELASAQPVNIERDTAAKENKTPKNIDVTLNVSPNIPTEDQALWSAIRDRTNAISFERYSEFINRVLCPDSIKHDELPEKDLGQAACQTPEKSDTETYAREKTASMIGSPPIRHRLHEIERRTSIYGVDAYQLHKLATQAFLVFESGVVIKGMRDPGSGEYFLPKPNSAETAQENNRLHQDDQVTFEELQEKLEVYLGASVGNVSSGRALPYLKRIVSALPSLNGNTSEGLPYCDVILQHRYSCPSLIELIWSYWHEEGMLVQTMNAITMRFQNIRNGPQDPLVNLALDPLRPLSNLMWGFVQDENNRLSVQRRNYEYQNHYGVSLIGKAVDKIEPADSRSKFIEAFHNLLHRTVMFYREDDDTTIHADAFSLLNSLREVHLVLSEGAHNQFVDMPCTARAEMLTMEWLIARPEMREFIRGRHSVPYQETWMGAVDDMKRLQGWSDVTVTHFRELGVHGEQILLSIRYADWIIENDQERARNWARYWRPEIQRYLHAYAAVTGVDLSADITTTHNVADRYLQPSEHLNNRLNARSNQHALSTVHDSKNLVEPGRENLEMPRPRSRRKRLPKYDQFE